MDCQSTVSFSPGKEDPVGRKAFVDYFQFAQAHEAYYHPVESYAEVALVFPRQSVQSGDDEPVARFRQIGQILLDAHVLFDVLSDENLSSERLAPYDAVTLPTVRGLRREPVTHLPPSPPQEGRKGWVEDYVGGGRLVIVTEAGASTNGVEERLPVSGWTDGLNPSQGPAVLRPSEPPVEAGRLVTLPRVDRSTLIHSLNTGVRQGLSEIHAPWMVRVSAFSQPGRILLHLVNYNRVETEGSGPAHEKPIAVTDISVNLRLKTDAAPVTGVTVLSPDVPTPEAIPWQQMGERVHFFVPSVLVYAVVVVELG